MFRTKTLDIKHNAGENDFVIVLHKPYHLIDYAIDCFVGFHFSLRANEILNMCIAIDAK